MTWKEQWKEAILLLSERVNTRYGGGEMLMFDSKIKGRLLGSTCVTQDSCISKIMKETCTNKHDRPSWPISLNLLARLPKTSVLCLLSYPHGRSTPLTIANNPNREREMKWRKLKAADKRMIIVQPTIINMRVILFWN